jgi:hypothetical protein
MLEWAKINKIYKGIESTFARIATKALRQRMLRPAAEPRSASKLRASNHESTT